MQFELIAKLNNWNNATRAVYLATSLLADVDEHRRGDYKSLVAALSNRFGFEGRRNFSGRSYGIVRGGEMKRFPSWHSRFTDLLGKVNGKLHLHCRILWERFFSWILLL